MKKTETIVREDNTIFAEVDYIDYQRLRLDIIYGRIKEKLFFRNEHFGMDEINEYAVCLTYDPFDDFESIYSEIVRAQMHKRKVKANEN